MKAFDLFFFAIIVFYSCENKNSSLLDQNENPFVVSDSIIVYDPDSLAYRLLKKEVWHFTQNDFLAFKTDKFKKGGAWYIGTKTGGPIRGTGYREVQEVALCYFSYKGDTISCIAWREKNSFWVVKKPDGGVVLEENAEITFRPKNIDLGRAPLSLLITGDKDSIEVVYIFRKFDEFKKK